MSYVYFLRAIWNLLHFPFRKKTRNRTLIEKVVVVDWNEIEHCELIKCKIVFLGIGTVSFCDSKMIDCTFHFCGPAGQALAILVKLDKLSPQLLRETFGWRK